MDERLEQPGDIERIFSVNDIVAMKIGVASPEEIRKWASGEVRKPETINYRTGKPEKEGLFCSIIFGPIKDFECLCGKYKGSRYRGHVCENCGVEITTSRVRRERMGKIELAYPVLHFWYLKVIPSRISLLLDIPIKRIESVLNFDSWIIAELPSKISELKVTEKNIERMKKYLKDAYNLSDEELNKKYGEAIQQIENIETLLKSMVIKKIVYDKIDLSNPKSIGDVKEDLKRFKDIKNVQEMIRHLEEDIPFEEKIKKLIIDVIDYSYFQVLKKEVIAVLCLEFPEIFTPVYLIGGIGGDSIRFFNEKKFDFERRSIGKGEFGVVALKEDMKKILGKDVISPKKDDFVVGGGAEALRYAISKINLKRLKDVLKIELTYHTQRGEDDSRSIKVSNRLDLIKSLISSNTNPEWFVLEVLPVMPPELRPLIILDDGRIASSDLNDFYRMIIQRNNRILKMKRYVESGFGIPDSVIENEIRLLQYAVDCLVDNSKKPKPMTGKTGRPLRSLADIIKGKYGRFRQNLLGKRVDFSARSVIVVGPELRLHQIGVPKEIALELFKPFIIRWLIEKGVAQTVKEARRIFDERRYAMYGKMMDEKTQKIYEALEDIVKEQVILANRAPTLHRMSIQAFEIVLTEGKSIRLHPLVCTAYNADFDGDQMGLFLPISVQTQAEARILMLSTRNIMSPAHGGPIVYPTQDQVMGLYLLTLQRDYEKGEGMKFSSPHELFLAYLEGRVSLHARVYVLLKCECDEHKGKIEMWETTPGRVILYNEVFPRKLCFKYANKLVDKKYAQKLVEISFLKLGERTTAIFVDRLKDIGFEIVTRLGFTLSLDDIKIPPDREKIIESTREMVKEVEDKYARKIMTYQERYNRVTQLWLSASEKIGAIVKEYLAHEEKIIEKDGRKEKVKIQSTNTLNLMVSSGSRGSYEQIKQLVGIRGVFAKPSGQLIEFPVLHNLREGVTPLEYFISTHGGRKGLADTALKTAKAGYLTRKLVDVAQDVVVMEEDCGTDKFVYMTALTQRGRVLRSLSQRIKGLISAEDIQDPETGEVIVGRGELITPWIAEEIEMKGIEGVKVRHPVVCESRRGACVKCYGADLSSWKLVDKGTPVGIIAAQSIGEPGTQLTMRTFHYGGVGEMEEKGEIYSQSKGRVRFLDVRYEKYVPREDEEIERMGLKRDDLINKKYVLRVMNKGGFLEIVGERGKVLEKYELQYGASVLVEPGKEVDAGTKIAVWNPYVNLILAHISGRAQFKDIIPGVTSLETVDETTGKISRTIVEPPGHQKSLRPRIEIQGDDGRIIPYNLPLRAVLAVEDGERVQAGAELARVVSEQIVTKDITVGLPRAEEILEARKLKDAAIVSEISGKVEIVTEKDKRKVIVRPISPTGEVIKKVKPKEYIIPKQRHIIVSHGDIVQAGDPLTDGVPSPKDIMRIKGTDYVKMFLINELQKVYASQGVDINDKHFGIIVRQMLRKVRIKDPGDTDFIQGELVDRYEVMEINEKMIADGKKPAVFEDVLLGISRASLRSDSWIAAASFQETTKVLINSAIKGKIDYLRGIKENVIVGRPIPVGTHSPEYYDTGFEIEQIKPEEAMKIT